VTHFNQKKAKIAATNNRNYSELHISAYNEMVQNCVILTVHMLRLNG